MQLSAKWRDSWSIHSEAIEGRRVHAHFTSDEPVDVIRLGRGEPIVVIPGLAGGWKLLWPLVRGLARHFEVITFGLRGDDGAWDEPGRSRSTDTWNWRICARRSVIDRSIGSGLPCGLWRLVRRGDRPGACGRVSRSPGCVDRARCRSEVSPDDRLEDRASRTRAVSAAERQSFHQSVLPPALRQHARAWTTASTSSSTGSGKPVRA